MLLKLYLTGRTRQDLEHYSMVFRAHFGHKLVTDERSLGRFLSREQYGIPFSRVLELFGIYVQIRLFYWSDYTLDDDPC